jgi:hypothetical protein
MVGVHQPEEDGGEEVKAFKVYEPGYNCRLSKEALDLQLVIQNLLKPHVMRMKPRELMVMQAALTDAVSMAFTVERLRRFRFHSFRSKK